MTAWGSFACINKNTFGEPLGRRGYDLSNCFLASRSKICQQNLERIYADFAARTEITLIVQRIAQLRG